MAIEVRGGFVHGRALPFELSPASNNQSHKAGVRHPEFDARSEGGENQKDKTGKSQFVVVVDVVVVVVGFHRADGRQQKKNQRGERRRRGETVHALRVGQDAAVEDGAAWAEDAVQCLWGKVQIGPVGA